MFTNCICDDIANVTIGVTCKENRPFVSIWTQFLCNDLPELFTFMFRTSGMRGASSDNDTSPSGHLQFGDHVCRVRVNGKDLLRCDDGAILVKGKLL